MRKGGTGGARHGNCNSFVHPAVHMIRAYYLSLVIAELFINSLPFPLLSSCLSCYRIFSECWQNCTTFPARYLKTVYIQFTAVL